MGADLIVKSLAALSAATRDDIVPELGRFFRAHRATLERKCDSMRAELVAEIVSMARSDRAFLPALVADARYSELCHAAVMELDASMSAPDPEVRRHVHSIASGQMRKPKGNRGPKRRQDRELCIISAGCSLVAQALERAGIEGLGEHGVRKIWSRRARLEVS